MHRNTAVRLNTAGKELWHVVSGQHKGQLLMADTHTEHADIAHGNRKNIAAPESLCDKTVLRN